MYDESSSGYGRAGSATPSSDAAATPGQQAWPEPGLSFGLIHPRSEPFTGGHPDRVRVVRGRWRTLVNAVQHCWKACWGQPLRSSNLLSSATLTCGDALGSRLLAASLPEHVSHFLSQLSPGSYALIPDKSVWWRAETARVVPGQGRRGRIRTEPCTPLKRAALPFTRGRDRPREVGVGRAPTRLIARLRSRASIDRRRCRSRRSAHA